MGFGVVQRSQRTSPVFSQRLPGGKEETVDQVTVCLFLPFFFSLPLSGWREIRWPLHTRGQKEITKEKSKERHARMERTRDYPERAEDTGSTMRRPRHHILLLGLKWWRGSHTLMQGSLPELRLMAVCRQVHNCQLTGQHTYAKSRNKGVQGSYIAQPHKRK